MAIVIPWGGTGPEDLAKYPDIVGGVINVGRNFLCSLYNAAPDWTVGVPREHILAPIAHSLYRKICPTPPPPPDPPFPPDGVFASGCPCQLGTATVAGFSEGFPPTISTVPNVRLPVLGTRTVPLSGGGISFELRVPVCSGGEIVGSEFLPVAVGGFTSGALLGMAPNEDIPCSSALPPGSPLPPPPPGLVGPRSIPVPLPDIGVNFSLPVGLIRPTLQVEFNLDVNIYVGPFNLNFDFGGITIGPTNVQINPPVSNRGPLPPGDDGRPLPPYPYPREPWKLPPGCDPCDLTPVITRLDNLTPIVKRIDECNPCPKEQVVRSLFVPFLNSATIALPPRTFRVVMRVGEVPINPRIQVGFNGPDVLYSGWGWFGYGGGFGPRMPLDADNKSFIPEPDTSPSVFAWTAWEGYTFSMEALYMEDA